MRKRHLIILVTSVAVLLIAAGSLAFFSPAFRTDRHLSSEKLQSDQTGVNKSAQPDNSSVPSSQNSQESSSEKNSPASEDSIVPKPSAPSPSVNGPSANVIWSVPVTERAVFITIDDGWYPSQSLLKMMREKHFPVTAFLIQQAAEKNPQYWRDFAAAGGDIENHTLSHPDLSKLTPAEMNQQISSPMNYLATLAAKPTLFRPPYGSYTSQVCQEVYKAGIKHLVMWNAVMNKGILTTYNGKPIQPGSIVLLHWDKDLDQEIKDLFTILQQEHLGIASLPAALAHPDKFPITWVESEKTKQPSPPIQPEDALPANPSVSKTPAQGA